MNTKKTEALDLQSRDWPPSRQIAFSTMVLTVASISTFAAVAIALNITQPDLGKQSVIFPVLGTLLVIGILMALLGLLAGVVDLTRSHDKRGITVVSVLVNGVIGLLVFAIIIAGLRNV